MPIIERFEGVILDLRDAARQDGQELIAAGHTRWMWGQLARSTGQVADPDDPDSLQAYFSRADLDDTIRESLTGAAQIHEYLSATLQSDILSTLQREFVHRHRSRLNSLAVEASRRKGHGDNSGVWMGLIHRRIKQLSEQGA